MSCSMEVKQAKQCVYESFFSQDKNRKRDKHTKIDLEIKNNHIDENLFLRIEQR